MQSLTAEAELLVGTPRRLFLYSGGRVDGQEDGPDRVELRAAHGDPVDGLRGVSGRDHVAEELAVTLENVAVDVGDPVLRAVLLFEKDLDVRHVCGQWSVGVFRVVFGGSLCRKDW
jgi:hypothetical protein